MIYLAYSLLGLMVSMFLGFFVMMFLEDWQEALITTLVVIAIVGGIWGAVYIGNHHNHMPPKPPYQASAPEDP